MKLSNCCGANVITHDGETGLCTGVKYNCWALSNINTKQMEVIGNIYQNPELLKDKDD